MWIFFVFGILPLLLFVLIDHYSNLKFGVIAAVVTSSALCLASFFILGEIDYALVVGVVVMGVAGYFSVMKENRLWIKLQPVVSNIVVILILGWYQVFDVPIMLKYLPKMAKFMEPAQAEILARPEYVDVLARMTLYLMLFVFLHTCGIVYAAIRLSNAKWLLVKAVGVPFVVAGSIVCEMLYSMVLKQF